MAFQPNTTVYLCAGTGMDYRNSIWWHKFAYPYNSSGAQDRTYWNTCFQFFKSHSIAEGCWHCTYLDPSKGYFKFGRAPLVNRSLDPAQGESGLGSTAQQSYILNNDISVAETIRGVDYIIFANDGESTTADDVQYAFVDRIESVNWNTCTVYFTIDAIMTYQKYFCLGPSYVLRDMEFEEREDSERGVPNFDNQNTQPEPIEPNETDFIQQQLIDMSQNLINRTYDMGPYNAMFCTSDVSLVEDDITRNVVYAGLPSFTACDFSFSGLYNLGIGGYYVPRRKNDVFDLLGSYNAIEHILYSYTVPYNLINWDTLPAPYGQSGYSDDNANPVFVDNFDSVVDSFYTPSGAADPLALPIDFNDNANITSVEPDATNNFQPVNTKVYQAPYCYLSISDRMGDSLEICMQDVFSLGGDESNYYKVPFSLDFSAAPNAMSAIYSPELRRIRGSRQSPLLFMLQLPAYAMTPNNSGYNNDAVSAMTNLYTGALQIAVGGAFSVATAGVAGGVEGVANMAGGGFIGSGVSALSAGIANTGNYFQNKTFGLPKAVGGLPNGYTPFAESAGLTFFWNHMRTGLLKLVDRFFSVYGYAQNAFRYPHINIRKRWCYVQLQDVNMIPIGANNYTAGGVPFWARDQITQRLQAGVTFWNIRYALMGDADTGDSTVQSWDDAAIAACNNCQWVKNYGGGQAGNDIEWENVSYIGGYASEYTDDYVLPNQS